LVFFICAVGTTSFERQLNIIAAPRGTNERCCNELQMKLPSANDVLRNDVALRANGIVDRFELSKRLKCLQICGIMKKRKAVRK